MDAQLNIHLFDSLVSGFYAGDTETNRFLLSYSDIQSGKSCRPLSFNQFDRLCESLVNGLLNPDSTISLKTELAIPVHASLMFCQQVPESLQRLKSTDVKVVFLVFGENFNIYNQITQFQFDRFKNLGIEVQCLKAIPVTHQPAYGFDSDSCRFEPTHL